MTDPDREFAARLAALDSARFREFVAALYRASGKPVDRRDDGVLQVGTGKGDGPILLVPTDPGADRDQPIARTDGVQAGDAEVHPVVPEVLDDDGGPAPGSNDAAIDATDLRRRARYAVDADARASLARRYFDADPDGVFGTSGIGPSLPPDVLDGASGEHADPGSGPEGTDASRGHTAPDPDGLPFDFTGAVDPVVTTDRDPEPPARGTQDRSIRADPDRPVRDDPDGSTRGDPDGSARGDPARPSPVAGDEREPDGDVDRPPADGQGSAGGGALGTTVSTDGRTVWLYVVVVLAVTGLATAAVVGIDGFRSSGGLDDGERDGPGIERTPTPKAVTTGSRVARGGAPDLDGPRPAWMTARGGIDEQRLSTLQRQALANDTFRVRIVYRERKDGVRRARWEERAVVDPDGVTNASVVSVGNRTGSPWILDRRPPGPDDDRYRDPATTTGRGASSGAIDGENYLVRIRLAIERYLSVRDVSLVDRFSRDGRTYYWYTYAGDPWPGVENATGSVLVDEDGVVYALHRQYTLTTDPSITASVTIRIGGVDGDPGSLSGEPGATTSGTNESTTTGSPRYGGR